MPSLHSIDDPTHDDVRQRKIIKSVGILGVYLASYNLILLPIELKCASVCF